MTFIVSEDEALKQKLRGIIVSDEKSASREVEVWFAKPDVESRSQNYPFITIELIDINWASYRQSSGIVVDSDNHGTTAELNGKVYSYEIPVAWDLMYQITTYARHPRHDRTIIAYIMNRVLPSKRGFLAVENDLGTDTAYRHLMLEEFTKRDTVEEGRRLYRNVFTVTVSSEGEPPLVGPTPQVEEVFINRPTTEFIPVELQQP